MIVLIALVGLTALASAGMVITDTDLRASQNQEAGANAFFAADAGLQEYLGTRDVATTTDTFTYAVGSAVVQGEKVLDLPNNRTLYRVRSVSSYTPPEGGTASRTISRLALFSAGSFLATASFASGSGLQKNGGSGTITGYDQAPSGDPDCPNSPTAAVAGVAVPPGGYTQSGGGLVPEGEPDVYDALTGLELLQATGVPWDQIVNHGMLAPDYSIPTDSWPNFGSLGSDEWPVIYVDNSVTLSPSNSGRGVLIIEDNLTMNGSFQWDGIVLVGGYITSNGNQTISGATVTGLNQLLGDVVADSDIGNGNKSFLYHSCHVAMAATAAFGGLAEVPGSWAERWQ